MQMSSDEDKKAQPFKTRRGLELANSAPEVFNGLVGDLLADTGISMLCGKPKSGKSTLLRQLAVAIAEGTPFLNKLTKSGDVLYLSLEGPLGVVQQHLKKLGLTERRGTVHVVHEAMPFRGEHVTGLQRLKQTIKALPGLRLLIIDPIGKFLRVENSDKYDEVTLAVEKLEQLAKDYGLHLLFSTHGKKRGSDDEGDSPIGSTGFRGGTDCNIFLRKEGSQRVISTEQRWGVAMEPTLLLYDEQKQAMHLGMTVQDDEETRREAKERGTEQRIEREILDVLMGGKRLTTGELLELVTGKNTTILFVLGRLVSGGRIQQEQDRKATYYSAAEIPTEERSAA
jgi:AAA domain